jgi:hypothetical protein
MNSGPRDDENAHRTWSVALPTIFIAKLLKQATSADLKKFLTDVGTTRPYL